jgi:hypothetical protein
MQLSTNKVSELYQQRKEELLITGIPQTAPIAIILGGQPACGKSGIINKLKENDQNFMVINGDEYREYHPDYDNLIRNHPQQFPTDTQNFSNIFTENMIRDAAERRFNMIIEGTMRNPDVPTRTAAQLRAQNYRVGVAIIAAHPKITELGTYRRDAEQLRQYGFGRLSDIESHNAACAGLLTSADTLYTTKAVDFIMIYSYLAKRKLAEYTLTGDCWNVVPTTVLCPPSLVICREREAQIQNPQVLKRHIEIGMKTAEQLGNLPTADAVKKIVQELSAAAALLQKKKQGLHLVS